MSNAPRDASTSVTVMNEKLIFERSHPGLCAVSLPTTDVPPIDRSRAVPPELLADAPPPLPEVG